MKILAIGDVVSQQGCDYLREKLFALKNEYGADLVIVNGENSAIGNGILPQSARFIFDSGADVITLGNHALKRREIYDFLDENEFIIRPANYHKSAPGKGCVILDKGAYRVAVINLQGTVYLDGIENPFDAAEREVENAKAQGVNVIIIDFHAEASSEKRAMGFFLDGKISALFGTHTHVQTSDEQILPNGTGYITDLGMTGPYYSVLGVTPEKAIEKMRTNLPVRFSNPDGPCVLEGCCFEIDTKTGKTVHIERFRK
ncbi:MAG: TIGR00282 family metallophosphoesterase [Eubacterium sp.]|nr:TIGR00282 family metallophosphoesterase [Eubacterium sp.]